MIPLLMIVIDELGERPAKAPFTQKHRPMDSARPYISHHSVDAHSGYRGTSQVPVIQSWAPRDGRQAAQTPPTITATNTISGIPVTGHGTGLTNSAIIGSIRWTVIWTTACRADIRMYAPAGSQASSARHNARERDTSIPSAVTAAKPTRCSKRPPRQTTGEITPPNTATAIAMRKSEYLAGSSR